MCAETTHLPNSVFVPCRAFVRTAMARGKAENADQTAETTRQDMSKARVQAKLYAPSFYQPGWLIFQHNLTRAKHNNKTRNLVINT